MKSKFRENEKRCVTCRHWYNPADTYIQPNRIPYYWGYDPDQNSMCMKTRWQRRAGAASCLKYESRF